MLEIFSGDRCSATFTVSYDSLGARLPGGHTFMLRPTRADRDVFRQIFIDDEYSFAGFPQAATLNAWYRSMNVPVIIDAGANIGASAVWLSMLFPRAKVIAVEPDPENFKQLCRNAAAHPNIVTVNAAIGSKSGRLYLEDTGEGAWAFRTFDRPSVNAIEVPAMTVDDLLALVPGGQLYMLKIDIEGAEADLFSNPLPILDDVPVVAIELHDWMLPGKASSRGFLKWHVAAERDFLQRGENVFSVSTRFPLEPALS